MSGRIGRRKRIGAGFLVCVGLALAFCLFPVLHARATWFVDPRKFHASVHGEFSCQDCHEDVIGRDLHPNPEDMVRKRTDFFSMDRCLECHEGALESHEKETHRSRRIQGPDSHKMCYRCHEPHSQPPVREEPGRFDSAMPRHEQCGVCHKQQSTLPPLSKEDEACMACHRTPVSGEEERVRNICFHCHAAEGTPAQKGTGKRVALIDPADYDATSHANIGCTDCHPQAVRFNHGQQEATDCTRCHVRHHEKVAHELHGTVSCGACHLGGIEPVREERSKRIFWKRPYAPGGLSKIHDMIAQYDEQACRKCHVKENTIGAAAMILPPKSILCMPCHAATFSIGDATTIVALLVFAAGLFLMLAYVFTGSRGVAAHDQGKAGSQGGRLGRVLKTLVLDVLLQRRLYVQSRKRWLIHGLIFYPFLFRFTWGLVGLIGSLWKPQSVWIWDLLDKNVPITAFAFDLTGIMIIMGLILALVRGMGKQELQSSDALKQDRLALSLIGAIVVVGFILEGMRIAMTGFPPGSSWAFLGYAIANIFSAVALTSAYGYVWYAHAVLTGAFIAYLPFSRLAHIIISPLVLIGNAVSRDEKGQKAKKGTEGQRDKGTKG